MQVHWNITGLSDYYFTPDKMELYGDADYLKGGLVYADALDSCQSDLCRGD